MKDRARCSNCHNILDLVCRGGRCPIEVVEDYRGDTYRAIYTVRFTERIYVLHIFQKKAKLGIKTPKQDVDLIKQRLKEAEALQKEGGK